jgi:hypothetical protein
MHLAGTTLKIAMTLPRTTMDAIIVHPSAMAPATEGSLQTSFDQFRRSDRCQYFHAVANGIHNGLTDSQSAIQLNNKRDAVGEFWPSAMGRRHLGRREVWATGAKFG